VNRLVNVKFPELRSGEGRSLSSEGTLNGEVIKPAKNSVVVVVFSKS